MRVRRRRCRDRTAPRAPVPVRAHGADRPDASTAPAPSPTPCRHSRTRANTWQRVRRSRSVRGPPAGGAPCSQLPCPWRRTPTRCRIASGCRARPIPTRCRPRAHRAGTARGRRPRRSAARTAGRTDRPAHRNEDRRASCGAWTGPDARPYACGPAVFLRRVREGSSWCTSSILRRSPDATTIACIQRRIRHADSAGAKPPETAERPCEPPLARLDTGSTADRPGHTPPNRP